MQLAPEIFSENFSVEMDSSVSLVHYLRTCTIRHEISLKVICEKVNFPIFVTMNRHTCNCSNSHLHELMFKPRAMAQ